LSNGNPGSAIIWKRNTFSPSVPDKDLVPFSPPEQVQQHGEWQYQPLSACPATATVEDFLDWAVPKSVVPEKAQQQNQLPAAVTPASVEGTPRRSTRAGRGENPKYKDYVSATLLSTGISSSVSYPQPWYLHFISTNSL